MSNDSIIFVVVRSQGGNYFVMPPSPPFRSAIGQFVDIYAFVTGVPILTIIEVYSSSVFYLSKTKL